jgi:hypothetical protein
MKEGLTLSEYNRELESKLLFSIKEKYIDS